MKGAEILIASSPADADISCWNLRSGEELQRYKSCFSPPHGLATVAGLFLASSQLRDSKRSSSGSIFYWSWNKVESRSILAEPVGPLVSNSEGTYIAGGGVSGDIYLWEVATGKLLKKWHAHYRAVTCLVFNDDQSLLISGAEDGCVRVWSLFLVLDDVRREEARSLYEHSFHEHSLKVTDVKTGHGGCDAIIVSSSEDRTCKVWSLYEGKLLRDIFFPSIIDAIVLGPRETEFYAGGRDGKIHIVELNSPGTLNSSPDILTEHSKAVTCLASSADGFLLVSGSEDGKIRVWDTRTRNLVRGFRHTKGPVNNILVIRQSQSVFSQISKKPGTPKGHSFVLPPPLQKYASTPEENAYVEVYLSPHDNSDFDSQYISVQTMENQIKELERQGSSVASEVELERLRSEQQRSARMAQHWESLNKKLHQFCAEEIVYGSLTDVAKSPEI
ncbi:protein ROOT INITIATION DEFECTIVE 3 [Dorcoceras hygrometricum]|uniref:Protein ROOT INITIATION DEFECTIVE 3 n=1 Tax=Dorcoceras hygrometricum TaxID=472368 RepID=A0A2Z7D4M3_9LAMI|nr:protein ROOT INITIATION DEFECTIVE 3 [Dorcoceras hygrometricum]